MESKKKKNRGSLYNGKSTQGDRKAYINCADSYGMKMSHLSTCKVHFLYICCLFFFFPQDKKESSSIVASCSIYSNIHWEHKPVMGLYCCKLDWKAQSNAWHLSYKSSVKSYQNAVYHCKAVTTILGISSPSLSLPRYISILIYFAEIPPILLEKFHCCPLLIASYRKPFSRKELNEKQKDRFFNSFFPKN